MARTSTRTATQLTRDLKRHRGELLKAAKRNGASNVRIFGSVARGDANAASDVDVLVKMKRGSTLLNMAALQREFSARLKRRVDLVTDAGISPYLRKRLMKEAQPL